MKWKTKDGRKIPIKDLDDEHLVNIIRMLRRKKSEFLSILYSFPATPYSYAEEDIDRQIDYLERTDIEGFYGELGERLLHEAHKRGLNI